MSDPTIDELQGNMPKGEMTARRHGRRDETGRRQGLRYGVGRDAGQRR